MFSVTTVLPHNLLQTNPCIRHNFSTQVFRKRAAQLYYVGPELRYIFWPPLEENTSSQPVVPCTHTAGSKLAAKRQPTTRKISVSHHK